MSSSGAAGGCTPRKAIMLLGLLILVLLSFQLRSGIALPDIHYYYRSSEANLHFNVPSPVLLKSLFTPFLHPFAEPLTISDTTYTLPNILQPISAPFATSLCVVNVDSRPLTNASELFSLSEGFSFADTPTTQSGFFNHYMFAVIHGYTYKFVHAPTPANTMPGWARPGVFLRLFEEHSCEVIVYADSDVVFPHLHLPMEWLMNYWNVNDSIAIAMSEEPFLKDWDRTFDSHYRRNLNDGFMILQNTPTTIAILEKWSNCLSGIDYPDCPGYRSSWPGEQGAFSEFVRYDFMDSVKVLKCEDAFGHPELEGGKNECKGIFVRHFTMDKGMVKEAVAESLAEGMVRRLQEDVVRGKDGLFVYDDTLLDAVKNRGARW